MRPKCEQLAAVREEENFFRLDAQSSWVALVSKVGSLASYRNSGRAAPVFTILWA